MCAVFCMLGRELARDASAGRRDKGDQKRADKREMRGGRGRKGSGWGRRGWIVNWYREGEGGEAYEKIEGLVVAMIRRLRLSLAFFEPSKSLVTHFYRLAVLIQRL